MSENDKALQVGRLAEEVNRLKGLQIGLNERAARIAQAYALATQVFPHLLIQGESLNFRVQPQIRVANPAADLNQLLNYRELVEFVREREKVTRELNEAVAHLRTLAPHLI